MYLFKMGVYVKYGTCSKWSLMKVIKVKFVNSLLLTGANISIWILHFLGVLLFGLV